MDVSILASFYCNYLDFAGPVTHCMKHYCTVREGQIRHPGVGIEFPRQILKGLRQPKPIGVRHVALFWNHFLKFTSKWTMM